MLSAAASTSRIRDARSEPMAPDKRVEQPTGRRKAFLRHGREREQRMGIWDFVKEAGEFLGIGGVKEAKADDLKANVEKLKLPVEGLDVGVDGDKVTVSGKAPSQEIKEKVILALGNVSGVSKV